MPRPTRRDTEFPSHDSFLDIVANMVGILIILVMVVGVRVKNTPVITALSAEPPEVEAELKKELAAEQSLRGDVLKTAEEVRVLQGEAVRQKQQRDLLAMMGAAMEQEIRSRREKMDAEQQRQFDVRRSLAESRLRLRQLAGERARTEADRAEPTVVESYPTPLSTTVDSDEVHFQIRGGRVTFLPVDRLLSLAAADVRRKQAEIFSSKEVIGTVGPESGFRMHYKRFQNDYYLELIPVARQSGESVEEALAEGSQFRRALARFHPDRATVTFWTYPDSFGSYRRLKEEVFLLGYPSAGRPLPHRNFHIGFSTRGSKSAAQ